MTPAELHTAVLAALTAAEGAEGAEAIATPAPWHIGDAVDPLTPCNLHSGHDGRGVADGVSWLDAHLIAALRNNAAAAYRGGRRIIERHAPRVYGDGFPPACARCDAPEWPCPDYLDATEAVPNLPREVAGALRPF